MVLRIGVQALCELFLLLSLAVLPRCTAEPTSSDLVNMPDCAADCLVIAVANAPCTATNRTCVCTNNALQTEMTACVLETCTVKESLVAKNLTMTYCGAPVRDSSGAYTIPSITLTVIAGLCTVQRLALKLYLRLRLGLDDWFILFTTLVSISALVLRVCGLIPSGFGRDIWTLAPSSITNFGLLFFFIAILYFAQVTLLKLAILFFYLRIFFVFDPVRRLLWGTVLFNSVFGVIFIIIAIFQCHPISFFWEKWDKAHTGYCIDTNALTCSNAAISIALDIWMLALPMSQLRSLNLDWKKKIWVGLMFCVGTFVTVVSILRLQAVAKFRSETGNPTQDFIEISKWSTIEINTGIVCACMPSIRVLLSRLFPRLFASHGHSGNYGSDQAPWERRRRIPKRMNMVSDVEVAHHRTPSKETTCQGTGVIELTDNDETQLVQMRDLGQESFVSDASV